MYICAECEKLFDEPITVRDGYNSVDPPNERLIDVSPCCEAYFVEAKECIVCEEGIDCDYIELSNGEFVCENCYSIHNVEDLFERRLS